MNLSTLHILNILINNLTHALDGWPYLAFDGVHSGAVELADGGNVNSSQQSRAAVRSDLELDGISFLQEVSLVCQTGDAVRIGLHILIIWKY